ncbi:MAG: T9SS type A sorting domain-containing protein [Bacteroidota bacterium]
MSFDVTDANGNTMNVSDRFLVQRLPANGGTFVPPVANVTSFDTIRGVIIHSANGCLGANGRGYELNPFQASDYVQASGTVPPQITAISRSPLTPTSSQDVNITADIQDIDGMVSSATLFYAVGASNNTFLQTAMTASGSTYTGTIPNTVFADGDIVKYYICATDNDNLTACVPDVNTTFDPLFFVARDGGLTIFDVQFTPFDNGGSGYANTEVTVEGIVTATAAASDLGFVYIQQPGQSGWAGLPLLQNASLANLQRGDRVSVQGTIREDFGMTRMENIIAVNVLDSNNPLPDPVVLSPETFTDYDFQVNEQYEAMLVTLANGTDGITVVDENADDPNDFAEYRVGSNPFDPANGSRVLAGRVTGSAFGSLAFSYINDSTWLTNSGIMTVDACIVEVGDTMESISGIMYYSFGTFKLLPRNNDDVASFSGVNCPNGITTNLEEELQNLNASWNLYPNPSFGQFQVDYSFEKDMQAQLRILDMTGRQVMVESLPGSQGIARLNSATLTGGTYLVLLEADGRLLARKKLVIVK